MKRFGNWLAGPRVFWQADGSGAGAASDDGGDTDNPTPGGDGKPRTFTQDEVNAFVAERAKHAKSSAVSELLGELGFEKADELKALVARARETEQANKTELERANERIAAFEKEKQTWAQEKRDTALQLAVQAAATKLGIVDAEVALALIRGKVEFDDKGQPQGVEAALTELLKEKPYLKGQPAVTGGAPTNPPRNHSSVDDAFTAALYKGAGLKKE